MQITRKLDAFHSSFEAGTVSGMQCSMFSVAGLAAALLAMFLTSASALAQEYRGTIQGNVSDALIPNGPMTFADTANDCYLTLCGQECYSSRL